MAVPISGLDKKEPYSVSHYFLNGESAVFRVNGAECVERSITQVFNATISDPKRTIKDLEESQRPAKVGWAHPIGAVYDSEFNLVPESQFRQAQLLPDVTLERPTKKRSGTWVFLGYYNEVYGHFILEGLCRLWVLDYLKGQDVNFFFLPIRNYTEFKGRYTEPFLKAFNTRWEGKRKFTESLHIISEAVQMEHVIVPSRSFDIQGGPRADYLDIIDQLIPPPPLLPVPKRYYLSRKDLPLAQHKFINEADIEKVFTHFRFNCVNPQDLSLKKQLRAYQSAEYLAGAISSALHNSVFSTENCHVIAMNGRWPQTGRVKAAHNGVNFPNPVCPQDRLSGIKGQSLSYIENHRAFHLEGMLPGRMMYFIGPKYCYDLICKITGESPDVDGLINGISDDAAKILLLESTEFALNGNALSLVSSLLALYTKYFSSDSGYAQNMRRFNHRLQVKQKNANPDSLKTYTLFPDSEEQAIEDIINESEPIAKKILVSLRHITPKET